MTRVVDGGSLAAAPVRSSASVVAAGGAVYAGASAAVNACGIVFHLLAGALLGPAGYGAFGALVAILAALAVPAAAVEAMLTAQVSRRLERDGGVDPVPAMRRALLVGAGFAVLLLAAAPVLVRVVHLSSAWPLVVVAACCVPQAVGVVGSAVLCGQRRFATVGGVALGSVLLRIGVVVLLLSTGFGLVGAVAASLLAECLKAGLLYWQAARSTRQWRGGPGLRVGLRQAAAGTAAIGALQLLLVVDPLLARHFLPATEAGFYIAATTAARAVFFASQVVCTLGLPWFAVADGERSRRAAMSAFAVTASLGLAGTVVLALLGPPLLPLVFGADYTISPALLAARGLAAAVLSLLSLAIVYRLSRQQRPRTARAWLCLATMLVAGALWHESPLELAIATAVGLALGALPLLRLRWRPRTPSPGPETLIRPSA